MGENKKRLNVLKNIEKLVDSNGNITLRKDDFLWLLRKAEKLIDMEEDEKLVLPLYEEEWGYILAACEDMSCGYERTDPIPHCCDLNEIVPQIRKLLNVSE